MHEAHMLKSLQLRVEGLIKCTKLVAPPNLIDLPQDHSDEDGGGWRARRLTFLCCAIPQFWWGLAEKGAWYMHGCRDITNDLQHGQLATFSCFVSNDAFRCMNWSEPYGKCPSTVEGRGLCQGVMSSQLIQSD